MKIGEVTQVSGKVGQSCTTSAALWAALMMMKSDNQVLCGEELCYPNNRNSQGKIDSQGHDQLEGIRS